MGVFKERLSEQQRTYELEIREVKMSSQSVANEHTLFKTRFITSFFSDFSSVLRQKLLSFKINPFALLRSIGTVDQEAL